jgi:O-acetyl-ADP-ribose deacetylase (regulator of RNase III)
VEKRKSDSRSSIEILQDQYEKEEERRIMLEEGEDPKTDMRSSIEILQDQYEREEGQRIRLDELSGQDSLPEHDRMMKRAEEEALREAQREENERNQKEALEELEKMSLPSVKPSDQDTCSVTMESVDEETDEEVEEQMEVEDKSPTEDSVESDPDKTDPWTRNNAYETIKSDDSDEVQFKPREPERVEPSVRDHTHEDIQGNNSGETQSKSDSDPDRTDPWTRPDGHVFARSDDSDEIQFKPQDPTLLTAEPETEIQYVDIPAEDVWGPNYCKNIIMTLGDLFESTEALGHAVSADMRMGAGIAYDFKQEFGGIQELFMQKILPGGVAILERDVERNGEMDTRFIYNLVTKTRYHDKPQLHILHSSLCRMRDHAEENGVTKICLPRIGAGLDQLKWSDVYTTIASVFVNTNITIRIFLMPRGVTKIDVTNHTEALWDEGLWYCGGESQMLLRFISPDY